MSGYLPSRDRRRSIADHKDAVRAAVTLFSFISINWRGRPLRTYETVVNLIANTTNRGGLVVRARLDKRRYPTGKKIAAKAFDAINITPNRWHGDWNYVIKPREKS